MKKLILTIIAIIVMYSGISAQMLPESVIRKNNLSSNSTFFEIRSAMDKYWESQNVENGYTIKNGVKSKVPGWKLYKRWEYYWENRVDKTTGQFPMLRPGRCGRYGVRKIRARWAIRS